MNVMKVHGGEGTLQRKWISRGNRMIRNKKKTVIKNKVRDY